MTERPGLRLRPLELAALAAILALAALLRFGGLGREGLWTDECTTASWTRLAAPALVTHAARDNHPPLYFLLEKAVASVLGRGEGSLRLLSALASLAAVAAAFVLARRLASSVSAGLLAALFVATSPHAVHYAREARSYALLALLTLLVFDRADRLRVTPSAWNAVAFALVAATLLWSHDAGPVYVAGASIPLLAPLVPLAPLAPLGPSADGRERTRALRARALGVGLALLCYAPWIPRLASQAGEIGLSLGWAAPLFRAEYPWQIPRSLAALTPAAAPPVRNLVDTIGPFAWILLALVLVLLVNAIVRRREHRAALLRLTVAVGLPLVLLFVASLLRDPIYLVGRAEAPLLPLAAVAVALGLEGPPRSFLPLTMAVLVLALPGLSAEIRGDSRSWERTVIRELAAARTDGEPVVATVFHACLESYAGLVPGETLLDFPQERALHPDWIDRGAYDDARWTREATETVDRVLALAGSWRAAGVRAPAPAPARAWLVAYPSPEATLLADEMARRLRLDLVGGSTSPPLWIRAYRLPLQTAPAP